jgi:hypothetical protein
MKPTARLHKVLSKDETYQIGGLRLPSNSDQEVADHLLETHFLGCQPMTEDIAHAIPARTPAEEDWLIAQEVVDSDKLKGLRLLQVCGRRWNFPCTREKWN